MKIRKIVILAIAALAGSKLYSVISAATTKATPDDRSMYSSVTGSGSLWKTFETARNNTITTHTPQTAAGFGGNANTAGGGIGAIGGSANNPSVTLNGFSQPANNVIPDDMVLLQAAAKGDSDTLEKRLAAHAKVNSRDGDRRTPLMYASWGGYDDICSRLLAAGANIDLEDRSGNKAFDYAAGRGLTDTLRLLLERTHNEDDHHYFEYAAIIQAVYSGDIMRLPEGQGKLASVNRIDPEGHAPLHIVAGNGSTVLAEVLIKRGAQVDIVNADKQTPLHWAAWNNQPAIAELLLTKGADKEATDMAKNTALILAAQNNSLDVVRVLLAKGADKNAANKEGKTAAVIAHEKGYKYMEALLR